MKKRKKNQASATPTKTYTAFNTHLFLRIGMFLIFLFMAIISAKDGEIGCAIVFGIATLLPIFVFLISPLYMIFSYKEIKIVYVMGQKEIIRWTDVRNITSHGGFFSKYDPLPYYELSYPQNKKRPFFVNGEIPKTFKTKRLIKKLFRGTLYD